MLTTTLMADDYSQALDKIVVEEVAAYVFNSRNALIADTKILATLRAAATNQYPCSGGCTETLISAGFAAADQLQADAQFFAGLDGKSVEAVMAYIQNSLRAGATVAAMVTRMRAQAVSDRLKSGNTIYSERVMAEAFRLVALSMKPVVVTPVTPVTPTPPVVAPTKPGVKPAVIMLLTTLSLGLVVGGFVWVTRVKKIDSHEGAAPTRRASKPAWIR
jgi:hypothetical protein